MSELPSASPPPMPYQQDPNQSNLETLSIFYFILAGLQALIACFFLLYVAFGIFIAVAGIAGSNRSGDAAGAAGVGSFFICFGVVLMGIILLFAYLNYLAGQGLRKRKRLTLIYVMAVIACLNIPLGTILGIFTFITLNKPEVKATFTS